VKIPLSVTSKLPHACRLKAAADVDVSAAAAAACCSNDAPLLRSIVYRTVLCGMLTNAHLSG